MNNSLSLGLEKYVLPLPLDSGNAAELLKIVGVEVDMLHIDAAHDKDGVLSDLKKWWPLLRHGGILIGDDYFARGNPWPDVKAAFDEFFLRMPDVRIEQEDPKVRIFKGGFQRVFADW
jgi:predicted O-methyltransferase YrrM